jgi:polar amino acid transport system substrate-binding protein
LKDFFTDFANGFYLDFIQDDRYMYLLRGLGNTLLITILAVIFGIVLGFLVAIVRSTHDKHGGLNILNLICKIYLTVWRGTPTMVQLLIMYYIILASVSSKIAVAVIAFGLNSAAYIAEIVRSGIMSVDEGQFEAGRSLGLNYSQTMRLIILPQAFKNVLPALANEFITLLKETSISGYIALPDLTKGGDIIRSITYDPYLPLFGVALIYLVIVMLLTAGIQKLEMRLRANER